MTLQSQKVKNTAFFLVSVILENCPFFFKQSMLGGEDEENSSIKTESIEDSQPIKAERTGEDQPIRRSGTDADKAVAGDMMNELEALMNAPPPKEKA